MRLITLLLLAISFTVTAQTEIVTQSGLRYKVLKAGSGDVANVGDEVGVYETMGYMNAKPFYSIEKPADPIKVTLGKKQVIAALEKAIPGMKVGEVRELIVPPSLSQRNEYPTWLSKDSTLLYKVELVSIFKKR